jgi:hypothetical protein
MPRVAGVLAALVLALCAVVTRAAEPGHAWLLLQDSAERWRLIHAPPRGGEHATEPGTIRAVRTLEIRPDGVMGCGHEVYLWYHATARTPPRVLVGRAVPAVGDLWGFLPEGVFDPAPPLPPGWRIDAGVGTLAGPALLASDARGTRALLRLRGPEWWVTPLPAELQQHAGRVRPVAWLDAPAIADLGAPPAVWTPPGGQDGAWERQVLHAAPGIADAAFVLGAGRQLVYAIGGPRGEELRAVDREADRALTALPSSPAGDPARAAVAPDGDGWGRLVVIERDGAADSAATVRLGEYSLASGETLYEGTARQALPVSPGEFRLLAAVLVVGMIAVIVLTLRTGLDDRAVLMPEGWALAEPWRRSLATVFDALLAAAISGQVFGVSMWSVVTLRVLLEPGPGWWALIGTVVGAAVAYGVSEGIFGASPGKLLVGARVLSSDPRSGDAGEGARRLSMPRAILRSTLKWFLPPMAMLGLLDRDGRHRADQLCGAVVAVPIEPEAGGGG